MPQPNGRICDERLGEKAGLEGQFHIEYAATSSEELGNPVYTRQLKAQDYAAFDLLLGMDVANIVNMQRICGGDPERKIHLLLDYTGQHGREVADPWYTGDFEATWQDVLAGCQALLKSLEV